VVGGGRGQLTRENAAKLIIMYFGIGQGDVTLDTANISVKTAKNSKLVKSTDKPL